MKKTHDKILYQKIYLVRLAGDEVLGELGHEGCAPLHDQRVLAADVDGHLVPGDIGRCHYSYSLCRDCDQFIVNKPRSLHHAPHLATNTQQIVKNR